MSSLPKRQISLALQGGGAHGAFTWGVLDRLLEEEDIEIAAISGTSAGALNGAALKAGLVAGGREAARARLAALWQQVGEIGDLQSIAPWFQPFLPMLRLMQQSAAMMMPVSPAQLATQLYSPYAWGQLWQNPLEPVVRQFDFSEICADCGPAFFVGATNVRSGRARIFRGQEITPEALMASACLPSVFQAVEIDGEAYWDGGFTGNPALWPLYHRELPDDLLIVHVNPLRRESLPQTPVEIQERMSEISFNVSLLSELRSVAFVKRLRAAGQIAPGQMKDVRVHMIHDDPLMNDLSGATKLQPGKALIDRLFGAGQLACEAFLASHGAKIGHEPSVNLGELFL